MAHDAVPCSTSSAVEGGSWACGLAGTAGNASPVRFRISPRLACYNTQRVATHNPIWQNVSYYAPNWIGKGFGKVFWGFKCRFRQSSRPTKVATQVRTGAMPPAGLPHSGPIASMGPPCPRLETCVVTCVVTRASLPVSLSLAECHSAIGKRQQSWLNPA
jgi:hypothetical protein